MSMESSILKKKKKKHMKISCKALFQKKTIMSINSIISCLHGRAKWGWSFGRGGSETVQEWVNNSILCLYGGGGSQKGMTIIQESVLCYV